MRDKFCFYLLLFFVMFLIIEDALGDLVPLVQFKKREKHPWRSDTFTKSNFFEIVQMLPNRAKHHI